MQALRYYSYLLQLDFYLVQRSVDLYRNREGQYKRRNNAQKIQKHRIHKIGKVQKINKK
jgi:hypothetical protein